MVSLSKADQLGQAASALITDDRLFNERFILIEDRNSNIISLKYNLAQEIIYGRFPPFGARILVIKAGQVGCTTIFLVRGFKKVITQDNKTAVVVAHEEFLTTRLLKRIEVIYDRLPLSKDKKPVMHHNSTYEKSFPKRNSVFYIGTAGAKVFGRGEPIHFFLGSEFAFWPDPWKILNPTMDRVPLEGEMIIESTPNGMGSPQQSNAFYQLVQDAREGKGIWDLIVLPWWVEDSYKLPRGSPLALQGDRDEITDFTQQEVELAKKANWPAEEVEERIRWRRRKFEEKRRQRLSFWQEFYEDIVSCFTTTSEPFYPPEETERLRSGCYDAPEHYGHAEIWFPPEEDGVYLIAVDSGQGKATKSVALVFRLDLDNFSRVRHEATVSGFYAPIPFWKLVEPLCNYYHMGRLVPESNGHGMAFCAEAKEYGNLWWRTDLVSGVQTKEIGWMTTGAARIGSRGTKMYMMSELQVLLPDLETHDINLVNEISQVKYVGDSIAFLGADDYHDAAAIMAATRPSQLSTQAMGYIGRAGFKW